MHTQELFSKALALYKAGQKEDAYNCCHQVTQLQPAYADAYNLMGLIARDARDLPSSVKQFRKAIQINDRSAVYFNNLGQSLWLMGKEEDALKALSKGLAIDGNFIPSLLQWGKIQKAKGQLEEAIVSFQKILTLNPDHIATLNNLANVYQLQNKSQKAFELYSKALQLQPHAPELHFNMGNVLLRNREFEGAEKEFKTTLQLQPSFSKAHVSLAQVYLYTQQHQLTKEHLMLALRINPKEDEAAFMLGNYHRSIGEVEKAIAYYKKAVQANPQHAMAFNNMGMIYFSIGMTVEAHEVFEKAISLASQLSEPLYGMAKLKESEKKFEEASHYFEKALALPSSFRTQILFDDFLLKLRIARWENYDQDIEQLKENLQTYLHDPQQAYQISPLTLNYFSIDASLHKALAEKYASILNEQIAATKANCHFSYPSYKEGEKLRIGYISPDFRFHAVGMLLNQLFQQHDKSKVEVYAYSIVNNNDEYHTLFKEGADVFRDITRLSHEDAAKLINKDQVHVLIDLAGYTTYTRTHILALKPAAMQLHFMGYPDTMGGKFMDYILADRWLIPEDAQPYYTEKVCYLDHAFFSSPFQVSDKKFTRKELGLPEDAFVYCCFNSYHKLSPELFDVWMDLLKKTERSVLWITKENESGAENLRKEAMKRGVSPDRLIFAQRLPLDEYMAAYQCADLFLDTFHYSAGSTAVCALWGEVPILTYAGATNASRMGASIVHAAGLEEFICSSKEEYLAKALHFAQHPETIEKAKQQLRQHKLSLPLFNLKVAVSTLENKLFAVQKA